MIPNFEKRVKAFSIDTSLAMILILLLIGIGIDAKIKPYIAAAILLLVFLFPHFLSKGQSFGKRTQQTKIVNQDGTEAPLWKILLRETFKITLSCITAGIYMIICFFMIDEKQSSRVIHDMIFKTKVIDLDKKKYYKDDYLNKSESLKKKGL